MEQDTSTHAHTNVRSALFPSWVNAESWEALRASPDLFQAYANDRGVDIPPMAWQELHASLASCLGDAREYAGQVAVTKQRRLAVVDLRFAECDRVNPALSEEIDQRPALFYFHTHPACHGLRASYPSAEDISDAVGKVIEYGYRSALIATPSGIIECFPAAEFVTAVTFLESVVLSVSCAQRALYLALEGRRNFAEVAAICQEHGVVVRYAVGVPPTRKIRYECRAEWLAGLDHFIAACADAPSAAPEVASEAPEVASEAPEATPENKA